MALTWDWQRDSGAATGSPAKGTTRTTGVTNNNWKRIDSEGTAYNDPSANIAHGQNSVENWLFGYLSGTFNTVQDATWSHSATAFNTGVSLYGAPAVTGDGDRPLYTTPSTATNSTLTNNMTSVTAVSSGVALFFGPTGPEATGKTASYATGPCYTTYMPTQLRTTNSATDGDIPAVTIEVQYFEN